MLDLVAAAGSVSSFIDTAGEFVGKDIAVIRQIAAELGSGLGALDDVIDAAFPASDKAFSTRDKASTVSVTVTHSVVTV